MTIDSRAGPELQRIRTLLVSGTAIVAELTAPDGSPITGWRSDNRLSEERGRSRTRVAGEGGTGLQDPAPDRLTGGPLGWPLSPIKQPPLPVSALLSPISMWCGG